MYFNREKHQSRQNMVKRESDCHGKLTILMEDFVVKVADFVVDDDWR